MSRRAEWEWWELVACGAAAGGTTVWGLAAAARVGWLRMLLEIFPRSTWETVTWVLIPLLLITPLVVQSLVVARLASPHPAQAAWTVVGSVAGSGLLLITAAAVILGGVRHLTAAVAATIAQSLPGALNVGFGVLLATGWLLVLGRWLGSRWLRRAAVPLAVLGGIMTWLLARRWVIAGAAVLDRAELVAYFASVVIGGSVGSAWGAFRVREHEAGWSEGGRHGSADRRGRPEEGMR